MDVIVDSGEKSDGGASRIAQIIMQSGGGVSARVEKCQVGDYIINHELDGLNYKIYIEYKKGQDGPRSIETGHLASQCVRLYEQILSDQARSVTSCSVLLFNLENCSNGEMFKVFEFAKTAAPVDAVFVTSSDIPNAIAEFARNFMLNSNKKRSFRDNIYKFFNNRIIRMRGIVIPIFINGRELYIAQSADIERQLVLHYPHYRTMTNACITSMKTAARVTSIISDEYSDLMESNRQVFTFESGIYALGVAAGMSDDIAGIVAAKYTTIPMLLASILATPAEIIANEIIDVMDSIGLITSKSQRTMKYNKIVSALTKIAGTRPYSTDAKNRGFLKSQVPNCGSIKKSLEYLESTERTLLPHESTIIETLTCDPDVMLVAQTLVSCRRSDNVVLASAIQDRLCRFWETAAPIAAKALLLDCRFDNHPVSLLLGTTLSGEMSTIYSNYS